MNFSRTHLRASVLMLAVFCMTPVFARAADAPPELDKLLNEAQAAHRAGDHAKALTLANKAVNLSPTNAQVYWVRGRIHADGKEHHQAIADFTRVLQMESRAPEVVQFRGFEHFKVGNFEEAIADFNSAIHFVPKQEPYHWQRGIAQYYAGRYEAGRRQFELHQTVNSNDVENAVWHFLCNSRLVGVEKARAALLPIEGDTRVPMMKVYELFAGKAKPEDILKDASRKGASEAALRQQMFFAHLYLGLYHEAHNKPELAREHIGKAAHQYSQDHYMGDVARVHSRVLESKR